MTIDPAKKYRTRSGLEVRNVRRISDMCKYQFDAEIDDGYWTTRFYTANGSWHDDDIEHELDLIEVKEPEVKELDWTKPELLQCRDDSHEFEMFATDGGGELPIMGRCRKRGDEVWSLSRWGLNGLCSATYGVCPYDIIPKPCRVTGWTAVFASSIFASSIGVLCESLDEAKRAYAKADYPGCTGYIYIDAEVHP